MLTEETARKGLKDARTKHGITLDKFSIKTGVSIPTIIAIEKGHSVPQVTTLHKINKYLETLG